MDDIKTDLFMQRISAVKRAHKRARNPEWVEFWAITNNKLIENERARIDKLRTRKGKYYDSIR